MAYPLNTVKSEGKQSFQWLWQAIRGKRWYIGILLVLQLVMSLSTVANSLLFRSMVDSAVSGEKAGFWAFLAGIVGLLLLQLVLRAGTRYLDERTRAETENLLKKRLFGVLLDRNYASVTKVHSAEWMNRLTSDTVVVATGLAQIIPNVGGMVVKLVGAFAAILYLQPLFGLLILPGALLLLVVTRGFRPALKRLHSKIQESDGQVRLLLQERLDNLLVVKTFSQQDTACAQAQTHMEQHRQDRMRRNRLVNLCNVGFGGIMHGVYILGAAICGMGILEGTVSFGTLTAVLQLINQLQTPFAGLSGYLSQWYGMLSSADRLREAEDFPRDLPEQVPGRQELDALYEEKLDRILLEDLEFSYENQQDQSEIMLRLPSLSIGKGEFLSVVGHSGCGKSTLLKLLLCVYTPDRGSLWLCDRAGERVPLTAAHRGLFAYVPQGNQLMSGTIREILCFYQDPAQYREEEFWSALEIACAADFVRQLPLGLDSPLGEHGQGLSEGQLQRLAVARAIFSRRPVLLLDEATSALDEETEARLLENLRCQTSRTVLIVTHRPRALEVCDRVVDLTQDA